MRSRERRQLRRLAVKLAALEADCTAQWRPGDELEGAIARFARSQREKIEKELDYTAPKVESMRLF